MQALVSSNNLLPKPIIIQNLRGHALSSASILQASAKPLGQQYAGANSLQQRLELNSQAQLESFMQRLESGIETAMSKVLSKVVSLLVGPEAGAEVAKAMGLSGDNALSGLSLESDSFAVEDKCCACCKTITAQAKAGELSLLEELKQILFGEAAKTEPSKQKESGFWGFLSAAKEGLGTVGKVLGFVGKAENVLKKIF